MCVCACVCVSPPQDTEGPIARLLRCTRQSCGTTRAGMFANFTGVSPDGVLWPSQTWHFFLHLLHCLQILLAGERPCTQFSCPLP